MYPYVLAVTGASAQLLAERAIKMLLDRELIFHLILSRGAYEVWNKEMGIKVPIDPETQVNFWRSRVNTNKGELICHKWNDDSASIASGSYKTKGMVILPCSMGTIGRIAAGVSQNLIERTADVHLKEGRPLILSPRETPLSLIHLKNLLHLAEAGAKIVPPIPSWYSKPSTIEEMVDFMVVRLFDSLDENLAPINRWSGTVK